MTVTMTTGATRRKQWLVCVVALLLSIDSLADASVSNEPNHADVECNASDGSSCSAEQTLYGQVSSINSNDSAVIEDDEGEWIVEEDDEEERDEQVDLAFRMATLRRLKPDMFRVLEDGRLLETPVGVAQRVDSDNSSIKDRFEAMKEYLIDTVWNDPAYYGRRERCLLKDENCLMWAEEGKCDTDREMMMQQCSPTCRLCHKLEYEERCRWDSQTNPDAIVKPEGKEDEKTLNAMFERLTTDSWFQEQYQPIVHSRDPWIVTLETFLTDFETDEFIRMGKKSGYKRSISSSGKVMSDGSLDADATDFRTSYNAWCDEASGCLRSDVTQRVLGRMQNITNGVPIDNIEHLQLLRYEVGQYCRVHHDYFRQFVHRPPGVRMVTIFIYLNDVAQGGETRFVDLDMDIKPKRGRALIWPSILHESPHDDDNRTDHEALPVIEGTKYAVTAWVRQRNFMDPYNGGCEV